MLEVSRMFLELCVCSHAFSSVFMGLESVPSGESQSVAGGDEDALDDYQELSTREEQDIESMMEMCEYAISNAEAFAEQLSKELQVLDGVREATAKLKTRMKSIVFNYDIIFLLSLDRNINFKKTIETY